MINIFEPQVGRESVELVSKVFASKWLGRGNYVNEFETKLSKLLNVSLDGLHTISSCSDAIFGVFNIFKFPAKTEVIIPSISFPAIASSVLASGMIPKIVDIDIKTGNIDFNHLENSLNSRTGAIFITHYGGIPVDVKLLREIVGSKVYIFEDAACALGSSIDQIACGTQGDFGCWSFDAMKLLTCGEGGAFYISDLEKIKSAKEYFYLGLPSQVKSGIDRLSNESRWWEYQLNCPGRRSMFTNINAAIGLSQFENLSSALSRKAMIRSYYCDLLDKNGCNYLMQEDCRASYSNYFFTLIDPRRDEIAKFLKNKSIYTTFRYFPLHKIDLFKNFSKDCKSAEDFSNNALNIPIHHGLTDSEVEHIGSSLKLFFN